MVAIVDYGVGNLFSLKSSFAAIGADAVVTSDADVIRAADRILLPGVGAFGDAVKKLRESGLDAVVTEEARRGKPLMGICLGMQLLFEKSYEYGEHEGLALLKGSVIPMQGRISKELKIPHIGWNALSFKKKNPLLSGISEGEHVYFVHSYFVESGAPSVVATAEYGVEVTAAVADKNIFGCQFHPEKSGKTGLAILKAFVDLKESDIC